MSETTNTDGLLRSAALLHQAGRLVEADSQYRKVLEEQPEHPDALHLLGALTSQRGDHVAATALLQRAVAARAGVAEYHANLGMVLCRRGKLAEGAEALRQSLQLRGDIPVTWLNLANALWLLGQSAEAIDAYRHGLALKPDEANAQVALSMLLSESGQFEEAEMALQSAIDVQPDHAEAHWRLSQTLLTLGQFEKAWPHARWQSRVAFLPREPSFPQPYWDGSDLTGKTILLHTGQGIGDTIQFIRYAPLVAARGAARVVLLCHQPKLLRLLKNVAGVDRIVTEAWEQPKYDVHCSLLALPRIFKTTLDSIPSAVPYFKADDQLCAAWANRLATTGGRRRVGIVWAGNPDHRNDQNRSMPLSALAPLGSIERIALYSLQKGNAAARLGESPAGLTMTDVAGELNDFADTAALIHNLDLVISVDTSVAHLAGAMGKPVWMLLPFVPDWRWMLNRSDSPWYPTMRLFRQPSLGDWPGVIGEVARALAAII